MIELALTGIASGDPRHLTSEAHDALRAADLVLLPRKGAEKAELAEVRRALCAAIGVRAPIVEFDLPPRDAEAADYLGAVSDWHDAIAATWRRTVETHLPRGGRAALLVWGEPSLYDSTLRIAERLRAGGLPVVPRLVPGISALQLLAQAFALPLNTLGGAVLVTTGRRLAAHGWPGGVDTVAVMLDGGCAFRGLDPAGLTIYWGAYLGMPGTITFSGPLAETGPRIVEARAAARAARGWIMDTYLLRREGR